MDKLRFSEKTNNNRITNTHMDPESEKCQLNYSSDARNSHSEKPSHSKPKLHQIRQRESSCGAVPLIVSSLILFAMGLLSLKFTFTDIILTERLKMESWFPFYNIWVNPEDVEVRLKAYIFTVENANEFLSGTDSKIKIKEFGPIVYREHIQHLDIVRHDNSTLSYSTKRWAEFLPHANRPGILNETIVVPDFAVLATAVYANEFTYLVQIGYNYLHRKFHSNALFINITVYDYLWKYESKFLHKLQQFVPSMYPDVNSGILYGMYVDGPDRYNVKIGTKYGDSEFFQINTFNGAPIAPGYNLRRGDCYASVANSSEGSFYRQYATKNDVLSYWALCRKIDLYFKEEVEIEGIQAFKYVVRPDIHDRKPSNETDCYKGAYEMYGNLENGLSDYSKCYSDMPFATSQPHFLGRSEFFTKKIEGLNASDENHSTFSIIQPKLGLPMNQIIRTQVNMAIPVFSDLFEKEYQIFSGMVLPLAWIEVVQSDLPPEMISVVDIFINVLPIVEVTLTCTLFFVGLLLILKACVKIFRLRENRQQLNVRFVLVQRKSETDIECDTFQ